MSPPQNLHHFRRNLASIAAIALLFVIAWTVLASPGRSNSPNSGIGRLQMHVTNGGTIIILDTVAGSVSSVSKIEKYSAGSQPFGDKPSSPAHRTSSAH